MRKRMLSLALCLCMVLSLLPVSALAVETHPFTDVATTDWFNDGVQYVYEHNLMNGTTGTTFSPYRTTSRGMLVTMLYRMEGKPSVTSECPFPDVARGRVFEKPITWAAEHGIVTGYTSGKFGPDDNLTRQQLAAILYRYARNKGYDTSATADLSSYTDSGKISNYARTAMAWANAIELINGTSDRSLNPGGNATRAQAAVILSRFCEYINKETQSPAPQPTNYSVIFDLNYTDGGIYQTLSVREGEKVSKPSNPSRSGYSFVDWYTDATKGTKFDFNTAINSATTIYARWSKRSSSSGGGGGSYTPATTYTVIFDSNNGNTSSQKIVDGGKIARPIDPEKEGFTFAGWYNDTELTYLYDFDKEITGDITLYAGWQAVHYTVSFEANGDNVTNMPPNQVIEFGELATEPEMPVREEYVFLHWLDAEGNIFRFSTPIEEDEQLTASWIAEDVSVDEINSEAILELINEANDSLKSGTVQLALNNDNITSVSVEYSLSDSIQPVIFPLNNNGMISNPAGLVGIPIDISIPDNVSVESAKISFHYDPDNIDCDVDNLGIVWYDEINGQMILLDGVSTDKSQNTVSVVTSHFSQYAVVDKSQWNDAWSKQQYAVRTAETPYYSVVLVLDCSGSMSGASMQLSIAAAQNMIDKLAGQDRVAVLKFNDNASVVVPRTYVNDSNESGEDVDNRTYIKNQISTISANGGTNIDAALNEAARVAIGNTGESSDYDESKYQTLILLLSDGQSSVSQSTINGLAQSNLRVITVGFGSGVRQSLMESISNGTGGKYLYCGTATGLADVFEDIQNEYIGSTTDTDGDGLPDIVETQGMRNQAGQIIFTNPNNADTDNDGISDGEEMGNYDDKQQPTKFQMVSNPTIYTEKHLAACIDEYSVIDVAPSLEDASTCIITFGFCALLKTTTTTFSIGSGSTSKEIIYSRPEGLSVKLNQELLPNGFAKKWKIKSESEVYSESYPDNIIYYKQFWVQYNTKTNPVTIECEVDALNLGLPHTKSITIDPNSISQEYSDKVAEKLEPLLSSAASTISSTREDAHKQTQEVANQISTASELKAVDDYRQTMVDKLIGLTTSPDMEYAVKCAVADVILEHRANISISELRAISDENEMFQNFSFLNNILERIAAYTFTDRKQIEVNGRKYTVQMNFNGVANADNSGLFTCFVSVSPGSISGIVTLNPSETENCIKSFMEDMNKLKADEVKKMRRAALDIVAKSLFDLSDDECEEYLKQVCRNGNIFRAGFKNVIKNVFSDGENIIKLAEGIKNRLDKLDDLQDLYNDLKDVSDGKKTVSPSKLLSLMGDMDKLIQMLA